MRQRVVGQAAGRVLEIGLGTGLNLSYYPAAVRHISSVDVNPGMHRFAQRRAAETDVLIDHYTASAERLPFEDDTFDTVISTWTLCSIDDVAAAMREVRRVLTPGGRFLFVEHGLARDNLNLQRWQHRLNPINRAVGGGCNLNRDMRAIITNALTIQTMDEFYLKGVTRLGGYTYCGVGVK